MMITVKHLFVCSLHLLSLQYSNSKNLGQSQDSHYALLAQGTAIKCRCACICVCVKRVRDDKDDDQMVQDVWGIYCQAVCLHVNVRLHNEYHKS